MAKSVAKKSATSAKSATKAVAKKSTTKKAAAEKAPNPLHEKLIALMARKDGATIADFQTVEGFNIPSMAGAQHRGTSRLQNLSGKRARQAHCL